MATTFTQQTLRADSSEFQTRVRASLARECADIIAVETAATRGHAKRAALMKNVASPGGFDRYVPLFATMICGEPVVFNVDEVANTPLGSGVTDTQIRTALRNVTNAIAGVDITDT